MERANPKIRPLRVLLGAIAIGAAVGLCGFALVWSLRWATDTRVDNEGLVWLLPLIGAAVGAMYQRWGGRAVQGTPLVAREVLRYRDGVPGRMAPLIFVGTIAGHLGGAAVGREGAAVQLAAGVVEHGSRRLGFAAVERRVLLAAAIAAAFGAALGVPVAGVCVALSLSRLRRPVAIVVTACAGAIAAAIGYAVVEALGFEHASYPRVDAPSASLGVLVGLVVSGVVFGVTGRAFVRAVRKVRGWVAAAVPWMWLRPAVGGAATLGLMALCGRQYLGLSLPLIDGAFVGDAEWFVPWLKLVFTVVALGSGFVGGEMVPLLVVGSTLGAWLAGPLDVPAPVLVACGFVTVFAAATTLPLFAVVAAVELFGGGIVVPAAIVAAVARVVAGRPGAYLTKADLRGDVAPPADPAGAR